MSKSEQLSYLYNEYREEFKDKEIVVGDGNVNSRIILIGEAPGKDEVKLSKPFVGMAGKNLAEFLEILGLQRNNIYITNAIKHRLSKINEKTGRVVNRPATNEEVEQNRSYLFSEIEIINPDYIITLGNVPLKAIACDSNKTIGQVHGAIHNIEIRNRQYKLFPLYHPASIIYNKDLKDIYMEDLIKLKRAIDP